jgi:hypothetical protein
VTTRAGVKLAITVNGRRFRTPLDRAGARFARIGGNDGARAGLNRVRIVAYTDGGAYQAVTRTVKLPRHTRPAGAGPDRTAAGGNPAVVGVPVTLGDGDDTAAATAADAPTYDWKVIAAPDGADTTIADPTDPTPEFVPGVPGTYEIEVTVTDAGGDESTDTVTVEAQPNDPPIGVRLDTSAGPNYQITIDGTPVAGTGRSGAEVSYALINRSDRRPVPNVSGSFAGDDASAPGKIAAVANDHKDGKTLMIVSARGITPTLAGAYADVLKKVGGPDLSTADRQAWAAFPFGFAVIGVPGTDPGSAFSNIPLAPEASLRTTATESLSGYLQLNQRTKLYGFVFGKFVPFKTGAGSDSLAVGDGTYNSAVAGGHPGFQVIALEPDTLTPYPASAGVPPEASYDASDPTAMNAMVNWLKTMADKPGSPLVFVKSVGKPAPAVGVRDALAQQVARLGGTRALFNTLDGSHDYALVARAGGIMPAAETASNAPTAALTGVLAPTTSAALEPLLSGPLTDTQGFNADLMKIAYQTPTPFPPWATDGQRAASASLAKYLALLDQTDVRPNYVLNFRSAGWAAKAEKARGATKDKMSPPCACTDAEFKTVQDTVADQMDDVSQVQTYISNVLGPLNADRVKQYVNLKKIGDTIQAALQPPASARPGVDPFGLSAAVAAFGFLLPPPGDTVAAGFGALMGLFAFTNGADGEPLLPPDLSPRVSELSQQIFDRYDAAQTAATTFALIVVSDPNKLKTVADKTTSDPNWVVPNDPGGSPDIETASKRLFYRALLPVGYKMWWLQGSNDPQSFRCTTPFTDIASLSPWHGASSSTYATLPIAGGQRTYGLAAMSLKYKNAPGLAPPASLADPLFAPPPPTGTGLGFTKYDLFNPRVFDQRIIENNTPCDAEQGPFTLTIRVTGPGKVDTADGSISCTATCTYPNIERLTAITLRATPARQTVFLRGWDGDCSREREHPTCAITFRRNNSVGATFR